MWCQQTDQSCARSRSVTAARSRTDRALLADLAEELLSRLRSGPTYSGKASVLAAKLAMPDENAE